jgi:GDP-L-fucose synthase
MEHYSDIEPVNVGWGKDVSIRELADIIANAVGFKGTLRFDANKPDGTPRKLLDTTRLSGAGWRPRIRLEDGVRDTIAWYNSHRESIRGMSDTRPGSL